MLERRRDSCVDDHELRTRLPCEDVDRRATCGEVRDHLRRNFLWVCRDARARDTVIARGNDDYRVKALRHEAADRRDSTPELLEASQAAARLRLAVVFALRVV